MAPASRSGPPEHGADAVTHEVIVGKLLALVDEMAIVLARASMSPVVYEVLDFACGLCDRGGPPRGSDQRDHDLHGHLLAAGPPSSPSGSAATWRPATPS